MNDGSALRLLTVALVLLVAVVVARALLRRGGSKPRKYLPPSPPPDPVVLSEAALALLRLVAARSGESVSFMEARELLKTSPLQTAKIIEELRRPGFVDWFGDSASMGSHGYVAAKGRQYLDRPSNG